MDYPWSLIFRRLILVVFKCVFRSPRALHCDRTDYSKFQNGQKKTKHGGEDGGIRFMQNVVVWRTYLYTRNELIGILRFWWTRWNGEIGSRQEPSVTPLLLFLCGITLFLSTPPRVSDNKEPAGVYVRVR